MRAMLQGYYADAAKAGGAGRLQQKPQLDRPHRNRGTASRSQGQGSRPSPRHARNPRLDGAALAHNPRVATKAASTKNITSNSRASKAAAASGSAPIAPSAFRTRASKTPSTAVSPIASTSCPTKNSPPGPKETLAAIYQFLGEEPFAHKEIGQVGGEDDNVYDFPSTTASAPCWPPLLPAPPRSWAATPITTRARLYGMPGGNSSSPGESCHRCHPKRLRLRHSKFQFEETRGGVREPAYCVQCRRVGRVFSWDARMEVWSTGAHFRNNPKPT